MPVGPEGHVNARQKLRAVLVYDLLCLSYLGVRELVRERENPLRNSFSTDQRLKRCEEGARPKCL